MDLEKILKEHSKWLNDNNGKRANLREPTEDNKAEAKYSSSPFIYEVGKTVHPDKFDDSIMIECTNGIHFFITKKEALEY